jgi:hypothetical protein
MQTPNGTLMEYTLTRGTGGEVSDYKRCLEHAISRHGLAFQIPYVCDCITKIYRKQAGVIQNHDIVNVRNTRKSEAQHRKHKRLTLGGGQAYDRSSV